MTRGPGLEVLRAEIAEKTMQIVRLVGERNELARRVGSMKASISLPLEDERVEARLEKRVIDECERRGVDKGLGLKLLHELITEGKRVQALSSVAGSNQADGRRPSQLKIAVVGASGSMGGFFARYFSSRGHDVIGSDLLSKGRGDLQYARSNVEAARGADFVLLAVPIERTVQVAKGLLPHLKVGSVLVEMSSVKGEVLPSIVELTSGHRIRVVSVHPLFGPALAPSEMMKIAIISGKGLSTAPAKHLFPNALLLRMSAEEHDKTMAAVLSLTYLASIAYADAASSVLKPQEFDNAATPTASLQLAIARSVLSQNPKLNSRIVFGNGYTRAPLKAFVEMLVELQKDIAAGRRSNFERLMTSLARSYSAMGPAANDRLYGAFKGLSSK